MISSTSIGDGQLESDRVVALLLSGTLASPCLPAPVITQGAHPQVFKWTQRSGAPAAWWPL